MLKHFLAGIIILHALAPMSCGEKAASNTLLAVTWDARIGEESNRELSFPDFMGVETDRDGNVYLFGNSYLLDRPQAKRNSGKTSWHVNRGWPTTYLRKYDPEGNQLWERLWEIGPNFGPGGKCIAISVNGFVFLTGVCSDDADLDPGEGVFDFGGDRNFCIICLNLDGDFQWAKVTERAVGSIGTDTDGNLYYTGSLRAGWSDMSEQYDLDPGPGEDLRRSVSSDDYYLAKLDSSGEYLWGRTWTTYQTGSSPYLFVSLDGDATIACQWCRPVDFQNPTTLAQRSGGEQDICLARFRSNGDLEWVVNWGGDRICRVNAVTADVSGNSYIQGNFIIKGMGPNNYSNSPYVAKFNSDGNPVWEKGTNGPIAWSGLAVGNDDDLILPTCTWGMRSILGNVNPNTVDIGLAAFSAGGDKMNEIRWGSSRYDSIEDIAVDPDGNVFVTGLIGEECFLYKFPADPRSW